MTLTAAVLSVRGLRPRPWYGHVRASEDLFAEVFGAERHDVVSPGGRLTSGKPARRLGRALRRWPSRLEPWPDRPVDLLVMWASDLGDVGELLDVDDRWPDLGRIRVLVVSECWPDDLELHGPKVRALLERFDLVVNNMENDALAPIGGEGRAVAHLPHGAVTEAYHPRFDAPRALAVLNYGRRDPGQHAALRAWSAEAGTWYHYDTARLGPVEDPRDHQRVLGRLLSEASVSICNLGRFDEAARTGGASELGARFYESLAGGCVLAGEFPTSPTFDAHFGDAPGVVPFPLGADQLPDQLLGLLADPAALRAVHCEHRARSLAEHDIAHRLSSLLGLLDIEPPSALADRRTALAWAAAQLRP